MSWDTAKADPARALTALRQKHPPPSDIPEEAAVPTVDLSPVRGRIKDWLLVLTLAMRRVSPLESRLYDV